MKTIDIDTIEDGYKIEILRELLAEKGQELISIQATENNILGLSSEDISVVVKYIDNELTIFVGDNKSMKEAVKNGEL